MEVQCDPVDASVKLEVGWYYQILAINRNKGIAKIQVAQATWIFPTWWGKLRGVKPKQVIFV